jgi:hypothetical protein
MEPQMTLHTDPKKVAKQILPAGFTDYTFGSPLANFRWRKAHGHAGGRMIERALDKARALGFVSGPYGSFGNPDGSVMGHKGKMHHPDGWELEHYSSYGCVAYDNSFSMSLKQVVRVAVPA